MTRRRGGSHPSLPTPGGGVQERNGMGKGGRGFLSLQGNKKQKENNIFQIEFLKVNVSKLKVQIYRTLKTKQNKNV